MRLIIAALAVVGLIAGLVYLFPYSIKGEEDRMYLMYMSIIGVFMLAGMGGRSLPLSTMAKYAIGWVGIAAVLLLAYAFRDELPGGRLMAELVPHKAQVAGDGTLSVKASNDGHFHLEALVNGAKVRFMVDTGATDIVLSPEDAKRAGFDFDTLVFNRVANTANGQVKGASVTINLFEVGPIHINDIGATVNGAEMNYSLLGMNFLKRLRGYKVEKDTLTLIP